MFYILFRSCFKSTLHFVYILFQFVLHFELAICSKFVLHFVCIVFQVCLPFYLNIVLQFVLDFGCIFQILYPMSLFAFCSCF